MKAQANCLSCILSQAFHIMVKHNVPHDRQLIIISELLEMTKNLELTKSPSHYHSDMLDFMSRKLGIGDLYFEEKLVQNMEALELIDDVENFIRHCGDRLYVSLKVAAAGNIIDLNFGGKYDIKSSLNQCFDYNFDRDDYNLFLKKLHKASSLLLITDNAGEIAFDKLLLKEIANWAKEQGKPEIELTAIVKGKPVLNDATREDALTVGLDTHCRLEDTGCSHLGLPLELVNHNVKKLVLSSDLIIAKGQANFETLESESELKGRLFLLLKAKCANVANFIKVPQNGMVFYCS